MSLKPVTARPRRYRSSTSASNAATTKATEVLQVLLDNTTQVHASASGYPDITTIVNQTRQIHQHIAASEPPCPQQQDFRRLRGFERMLDILRSYSGFYDAEKRSEDEKKGLFELLHVVLANLSAAFRAQPGNRRYFKDRVDNGGWDALEQIIASIGLGGNDADLWTNCQLLGKLLSFALDDQRMDDLCQQLSDGALQNKEEEGHSKDESRETEKSRSSETRDYRSPSDIHAELLTIITPQTRVQNPDIMRAVVGFWRSVPREQERLSVFVLDTLSLLTLVSLSNRSALHETGIVSTLLRCLFSDTERQLSQDEQKHVYTACRALASLGLTEVADSQVLIRSKSTKASDFCLNAAGNVGPPFIQFDLSHKGHSALELPTLTGTFPPQTAGYTLTFWFRIDKFDSRSHTTLFGVFDKSQTCFLLAYIEQGTNHFILQTSLRSKKPSVRFKSIVFKEGQWYHLAVVHRRPKALSKSKASLYVDGEFVEQLQIGYPASPPSASSSGLSSAIFTNSTSATENAVSNPVQAFLGTPAALSDRESPRLMHSKWSLASAHLFEDLLSDDLLAVHYRLSPRYQGNFQDRLGGFQTYDASAALALRNETLHSESEEKSDIMRAVREKASSIFPEQKILLSILANSVISPDTGFMDSLVFRSLSRPAMHGFMELTTKRGSAVAINNAIPSVNDAVLRPSGAAILAGETTVVVPYHFDDNLWRLGGFTAVALKLIERSASAEDLVRSLELTFLCINRSWRNSEAMERDNGYAILTMLLRLKTGFASVGLEMSRWRLDLTESQRDKLGLQILSLVLDFVGYNHADPLESFIINPLAYRVLLIDLDIWRKAAPITQELYYKQFVTFAVKSKHHQFNCRRILRMRIVKRLLDGLKGESMPEAVLPHFLAALETLVKCNYNAEVHRTLAMFITYCLHSASTSLPRTPKPYLPSRSSTPGNPRRATLESKTADSAVSKSTDASSVSNTRLPAETRPRLAIPPSLTRRQLGVRLLDLYTEMLCEKDKLENIRKFAKTVTNKVTLAKGATKSISALTTGQWLLYLLSEDDLEVVVLGCRILARLLVTQPQSYTSKFASKTGGFLIMAHRLKIWWNVPTLWPVLFSIFFGYDVGDLDFSKPFGLSGLLDLFGHKRVACADCLPVITSMLENGLRHILRFQDDPNSPANDRAAAESSPTITSPPHGRGFDTRPRSRSMLLSEELQSRRVETVDKHRVKSHAIILETVLRFLADMQRRSSDFRDFALGSDYVRLIITTIYPVIVSNDPMTPEIELNSKDGILNFEGVDVMMRPIPGTTSSAPVVKTVSSDLHVDAPLLSAPLAQRPTPLRRPSSFVFVGPETSPQIPAPARLAHVMSPKKRVTAQQVSNNVLEGLVGLIMDVFQDQVLARGKFHGFGLFLRVPPGFQEHQAYFETYLLRQTLTTLGSTIQEKQSMLCEPKVLTNMASFCMHMGEAIYEGWFMNGAEPMLDFAGMVLEYLQRPEVCSLKSVRLCSVAAANIRAVFLKLILLRLSDMDDPQGTDREATATMEKMLYWQVVILNCLGSEEDHFLKLLWYQLYIKLIDTREPIRLAAATMWRVLLVQKPDESAALFRQFMASDQQQVGRGFRKLIEVDDRALVEWVDQHRPPLDVFFFGSMSKIWEDFVSVENQRTLDTAKSRVRGRREKLRQWQQDYQERENVIMRHDFANGSWMKTIYYSEHHRHQKLMQDQQDDMSYNMAAYMKMDRNLRRPGAAFAEPMTIKWKLDRTEGRNRMRFRLLPDHTTDQQQYQPKRKNTDTVPLSYAHKLATNISRTGSAQSISSSPLTATPAAEASDGEVIEPEVVEDGAAQGEQIVAPDDDFEMVEDINEQEADNAFEDKNRKVMRRLELHDAVQDLYNVSRIIGLEASEGILIIGKNSLYLVDNVFQRADGEIVNAWQAPAEERDEYSQIISAKPGESKSSSTSDRTDQDSRSWKWQDVLSISKRRFLFRDVAVEVFFTDGRSYLLTAMTAAKRDEIFLKMIAKAPHTVGNAPLPNPEDAWRLEGIKVMDEAPKTFGSKFGGMFNASPWNPFVKRWQRGEMSNFHYLMLINTMAGRTFNDLTQYPVFPWVLADYTSDELDLDNPTTFRDLSKPMGAQTTGRQTDFTTRYKGLQEVGETPFHYGTHYSSAMIVTSFLIRLPPFVQSYMLLQGGSFDHPDRLFFSIEGAWRSASRDNGTDVRELIPEFYYLPDFLTNFNGYDFGLRQGKGGRVDNVILPPWAKGDPKIFIAKHREALESPYVSENLHLWIDLIFGSKQRGEAAIENLNVFHHLSYQGARNLDNITDPKEKAITTGIIHNFGQTPYQIFTRPHPPREHAHSQPKRLDTAVDNLAKLPYVLQETHTRVASLIYTPKLDRLLCASPFRLLNLPPHYDKFLEWGYADNSVRFFHSDNRKPAGLFENLHIGQLSCLAFADAKTLITAGEDCVVSVHSVQSSPGKSVELLPKSSLFGHKTPVNVIAVSKPLSTILTVSQDGIAMLWDLNRLEFARKLPFARSVERAAINNISGEIMLCTGPNVLMYTLNGELLLDQNVCAVSTVPATQDSFRDDFVVSCAFYEGAGNEWLENYLVFTGHRRGRVNVWRKTVDRKTGKWVLELLRRLDHVDSKSEDGANVEASITCIAPMPTVVYTGDEDGRVYEWNIVQRER